MVRRRKSNLRNGGTSSIAGNDDNIREVHDPRQGQRRRLLYVPCIERMDSRRRRRLHARRKETRTSVSDVRLPPTSYVRHVSRRSELI